jgi:putative glutamine amidotransferase
VSTSALSPRIAIFGSDLPVSQQSRGCNLWPVGTAPAITEAGGVPVALRKKSGCSWNELLGEFDGVLLTGAPVHTATEQAEDERLCEACRELRLPLLAIDRGLHALNTTYGGTLHLDVSRELPQALQHRQPPEPGVRHAIEVTTDTRVARFYGEGEIVVNSEHRRAVCKVARGFRVSARALDGVIEAIETETEDWFAVGVQWHPASASASGLDIQLFRGFIQACRERQQTPLPAPQLAAA